MYALHETRVLYTLPMFNRCSFVEYSFVFILCTMFRDLRVNASEFFLLDFRASVDLFTSYFDCECTRPNAGSSVVHSYRFVISQNSFN